MSEHLEKQEPVESYEKNETPENIKQEEITTNSSRYLKWLHALDIVGVENRGIERVPPEERDAAFAATSPARQFFRVFGLWFSACGGLTSMSSYFLPTLVFGLNVKDALVSGVLGTVIGCLVPAYCSIEGPRSGCRQIVSARFLFGHWGVRLVVLFVGIGFLGFSIVNCVLGGQVLAAISNVSLAVGIVVICIVSLIVSIFGIHILLKFETIFSFPITIAVILFYVVVFKKHPYIHDSNEAIAAEGFTSLTNTGNWLSFFTIGFSVTATWGGAAADYYIMFPETTPSWQIFTMTFLGIAVPTTFVAIIGTVCGALALGYQPWNEVYHTQGVGGLIAVSFEPWGNFGKFVVVLLYISLICNNIVNNYSIAFCLQLVDKRLAIVPRWVYSVLFTVVCLVISLVGKDQFSTIIANFVPMLGYWISIYIVILLEENLIFRSNRLKHLHYKEFDVDKSATIEQYPQYRYNWNGWDRPELFSHGIAAMASFAVGAVGAVVGMNQVYWQGPIARHIGDFGGDIGFFLCGAFSAIVYPFFRYAELKHFGK
ncbi:vitamin B6 transporter Tpn1p [[Candida] jaroonii]|uniref:Vitamin B6 transporter Tpn1p n=1 Tax=[Candida] jaroonii TaxID=467808 RepID=A0ACA9YC13_9ASCO|nr:vitamin B6 transporter Tpn1p [[Candida] jaroonii]